MTYIYQKKDWPNFSWSDKSLLPLLGEVRQAQGRLVGKMSSIGFKLQDEAILDVYTTETIKSFEIEGEVLEDSLVRSSVANKLGLNITGLPEADRHIDGIIDMMFDATANYDQPLTKERLEGWHHALFPRGFSGVSKIITGNWRDDSTGPMQVISGAFGREKIHFEAPPATLLDQEMNQFLNWLNAETTTDPVIKAAIAHLWFVTLHPFDDGNGRICRAITDLLLARADGIPQRFYSMSAQIRKSRKGYYENLEKAQKGSLDLTKWIQWFLECTLQAIELSSQSIAHIVDKHIFWTNHIDVTFTPRQKQVIQVLFDNPQSSFSTSRWAKIGKCSKDSALRDIQSLVNQGVLTKSQSGGRSSSYEISLKG
ncbi:MAG: Fic family protein [Lentisphaeria bacterium]|nr:Fic family protein [Lentisphaeria bacterium]